MSSLIKYFKKLFFKKEPSVNNKINVTNNYIESISELNLSDGEKIELLVIKVLGIKAEEISDNSDLRIDFGAYDTDIIELFTDIENLFNIEIQEGAFRLTIEELKKYVEKKINNPDYFIPEDQIFKDEILYGLDEMLYEEHSYGMSLAIKGLVENKYIILQEESGNRYKELINFTILYFTSGKFSDNEILIKTIQKYFPTMGNYLIRQLNIIDPSIQFHSDFNDLTIDNLDEKKGYDEFLNFTYILLINKYPDKYKRDNAIRINFKFLAGDLISFIDEKLKNT